MNISRKDVREIFRAVLDGRMSRDAADRWAYSITKEQEAGTLVYLPRSDEERIWDGVMFLYGVDLKHSPTGSFISSEEDIKDAMGRTVGDEEG
ncbi:MAG: hypothetical protein ABL950_09805 [Nitrospira sp.]